MKGLLILFALLAFDLRAEKLSFEKLSFFEDKIASQLSQKLMGFPSKLDNLALEEKSASSYYLDQVDLSFDVSLEAGVKFFSAEIEKGVELIWNRAKDLEAEDKILDINLEISEPEKMSKSMFSMVMRVFKDKKDDNKFKRRMMKLLYRDAKKINRYVKAVSQFNRNQPDWYVDNYFKNYNFSLRGEVLGSGLRYDKRVRFRLRMPSPIIFEDDLSKYEERVIKRLEKLSNHFKTVADNDEIYNLFHMNRVRYTDSYAFGFSIGAISAAKGTGITLEFKPKPFSRNIQNKFILHDKVYSPKFLRAFATTLEKVVPEGDQFKLAQIRIKGSLTSELDLILFNISKSRDIEYHYRRL